MATSLEWREVWHLRRIVMPRRSITGRLLWGVVWRRRHGRQWIYESFVRRPPGDTDVNIGSLILLARLIAEQNRFRAEYRKLLQLRYKVRQAELRNSRRADPAFNRRGWEVDCDQRQPRQLERAASKNQARQEARGGRGLNLSVAHQALRALQSSGFCVPGRQAQIFAWSLTQQPPCWVRMPRWAWSVIRARDGSLSRSRSWCHRPRERPGRSRDAAP